MKITVFLVSLLVFLAICIYRCRPKKTENKAVNVYVESFVDFYIIDSLGYNLLLPEYNYQDKIDVVTYDKKERAKVYYDSTKMAKKGYLIDNNDYSIRLYLFPPQNDNNISETLLRFDNKEVFIFKTEFEVNDNSYQRKKIWVNDILFWYKDSIDSSYPQLIIK